jgi:RimJ/RimL family protein N-acetyltransferase
MTDEASSIRPVEVDDFEELFELVSAVAAEGKWIGAQAPLERDSTFSRWHSELGDGAVERFVAMAEGRVVGEVKIELRIGIADLGMMVSAEHRGRGIGTALLQAVIAWARAHGAHKLALQVWPHNHGARRLYETFGFVEEGRLRRHYRRRTGELWDAIIMGLVLDDTSDGSQFADEESR